MTTINATQVKQLRDRTGAGMMDCKSDLIEDSKKKKKAVDIIQKKGLAKAAKKAGAIATEGLIHSYIHAGSRIGVLVEVNCQTDFVSRNEEFRAYVDDVALQIASMAPSYVRREEISESDKVRQKAIFEAQLEEEDAQSGKARPTEAKQKIIEGKLNKWMSESCLMDQHDIRDGDKTLQQMADLLSAKIGEKIWVRRFVRFELGEGIEKGKSDLAADVADALKSAG